MEQPTESAAMNEALFLHLVMMFQMAAMQQMGKIPNPITQKIEQDLEQARNSATGDRERRLAAAARLETLLERLS